jgi:hypothetical protein
MGDFEALVLPRSDTPVRLVFVHGIHQEDKTSLTLQKTWEDALLSTWAAAGLEKPDYTLEMPYYAALLAELICRARSEAGFFTHLEETLLRDIGIEKGISEHHVRAEFDREIARSRLARWQWVQGIARILERDVPDIGDIALRFVRQVDAYLTCQEIRDAVDSVVRPSILKGPAVIVAHSLGSVITYRLLREAEGAAEVPLFVTLGSPLGFHAVKQYLNPPSLAVPIAVQTWLNAADARDCVALYARLDRNTFADGIENVANVHHARDNPHAIAEYIGHATVAERIHVALSGS